MKLRRRDNEPAEAPARPVRSAVADTASASLPRPAGSPPLGELLVARNAVSAAQLHEALLQQSASGKRVGTLLVELGALDEHELAEVLGEQLGLAIVDLGADAPEQAAVDVVPESIARAHTCVPMMLTDVTLVVAVADPTADLLHQLETTTGRDVTFVLGTATDIRRALDRTYRSLAGVEAHVKAFEASGANVRRTVSRTEVVGDDAPVVQVVNMVITQALRDRASDIHVEPQPEQLRIRFRIDGALHEALTLPAGMSSGMASRIKIMAGMNIVERRRPQDGQITMEVDGRSVDIRVATTGTVFGEKIVLRILDKTRSVLKLADLGMPAAVHELYAKLVHAPFGMVVCAGPTGSGKTTTLYASLSEIDSTDRNITTIEDPVEYVFPTLTQIQINEAAGITFAGGLKSILRQDPDVILVGEIRDAETGRIAVQSALTGHLVMSSLHATDAVSALYRFLDMGIESFLVASSVRGVVGQRLVRRTCRSCRAPYTPSAEEMSFYTESGGPPKAHFYAGTGCNSCAGTGFSDRIGVYELMHVTEEMRQLIVQPHPSHDEMRRLAVAQGMRTLHQQAVDLVQHDVTTIAEVVRTVYTD